MLIVPIDFRCPAINKARWKFGTFDSPVAVDPAHYCSPDRLYAAPLDEKLTAPFEILVELRRAYPQPTIECH
jgi:hypothetical protein